jgi:Resolvase, N terminal domain
MKAGYARVSTKEQTVDLQVDALKKAGCTKVYTEIMSGIGVLGTSEHNAELGIMQSIFRSASRREPLGKHSKGGRRGGELKIDWTKPLPRAWPMCIVCRLDLWQGLKEPEAVSARGWRDSLLGLA